MLGFGKPARPRWGTEEPGGRSYGPVWPIPGREICVSLPRAMGRRGLGTVPIAADNSPHIHTGGLCPGSSDPCVEKPCPGDMQCVGYEASRRPFLCQCPPGKLGECSGAVGKTSWGPSTRHYGSRQPPSGSGQLSHTWEHSTVSPPSRVMGNGAP